MALLLQMTAAFVELSTLNAKTVELHYSLVKIDQRNDGYADKYIPEKTRIYSLGVVIYERM